MLSRVLLIGLLALSSTAGAETARARLDAFAKGLQSVSAGFEQTVFDANDKPGKKTSGTLAVQAPRQFRWDVSKPYEQQIVADGMHVWIYDPDLEQVTVRSQSVEEAHSPLTVLTDLAQLDRDFAASEQGEHDGLSWLRLKSKAKEPEFEYADFGFACADAAKKTCGGAVVLQRMLFKDTLGNRTETRFSDWQRNPKLAADRFTFTPPPGVDVIGEVKPGAEVHPLND
ncbi:outer membrane lipoprotein chaperone LolA [Tahibacter sp. P2K]|uniref:Outer-membrane lipoprotein carrier protein n=1 Tax=Tahibacter harae TaxID=2963937 RepID=A0ABT1QVG5_9GAMM|nr:outer membrane lipoprotein chaperone LolA [Tahibacter harae]MCQ4166277.1 outer membrane lipoprotein chaperone LolA [Tahibacter harae]